MAIDALPNPSDKARVVEAMFDRVAPRYDRLNRLLTFRLDHWWRRAAIRCARITPGDRVVDLGCGTGDLLQLAAAGGARSVGVDVSAGMLAAARHRGPSSELLRADAAQLPLRPATADVVLSGFALRNFLAIPPVLAEAARILRPGGRLVLLEIDTPRSALLRMGHALYFTHLVPRIGGWLSDRAAYGYLPRSAAYLPPEPEMLAALRHAGFTDVYKHRLSGGVAQVVYGCKQ